MDVDREAALRELRHRRAALVADLIMAMAVGLLVLILLAPTAGVDSQPPRCTSTFGYAVPCSWPTAFLASAAGVATTAVVLVAIRRRGSSRPPGRRPRATAGG